MGEAYSLQFGACGAKLDKIDISVRAIAHKRYSWHYLHTQWNLHHNEDEGDNPVKPCLVCRVLQCALCYAYHPTILKTTWLRKPTIPKAINTDIYTSVRRSIPRKMHTYKW